MKPRRSHRLPATLLALFAPLLPGTAQGATAFSFAREADTGSVWVHTGSVVIAEWKSDGTLIGREGAFNPFTYASPRIERTGARNVPVQYAGNFGITADARAIYRRGDDGRLTAVPVFDGDGANGCHETDLTSACLLLGAARDSRGLDTLFVRLENGKIQGRYWTGREYRAPDAVEAAADAKLGADAAGRFWSPDGKALFGLPFTSLGNKIAIQLFSGAGSVTHEFVVDEKAIILQMHAAQRGDLVYAYVAAFTSKQPKHLLVRLRGAFGATPALETVATLPDDSALPSPDFLGFDATHLYYGAGNGIVAIRIADGVTTPGPACTLPPVALAAAPEVSPDLWIGCGPQVLQLSGGSVTSSVPTGGRVVAGAVFDASGATRDLVVEREDGAFERLRAGQPAQTVRFEPLAGPPAGLARLWEDRRGPCGYDAGRKATVCEEAGVWRDTDLGLGEIVEVRRVGEDWWATSMQAHGRAAWRRRPGQDWEKRGAWDGRGRARLLRQGRQGVGVDLGDGRTAVFDGDAFREGFAHAVDEKIAVRPAFGSDGFLYTICPGVPAETAKPYLCRIGADGAQAALAAVPTGTLDAGGTFSPLRRGLLFQAAAGDEDVFVVRGTGVIPLGHLYGEFLPQAGEFQQLSLTDVGDGSVLIVLDRFADNRDVRTSYTFDGERLVVAAERPARHAAFPFARDGSFISFGQDRDATSDLPQAWQALDGLWRAPSPGALAPFSVGDGPLEATLRRERVAPDFANDAAMVADAVVIATDDGLWACPVANAAVLSSALDGVPQTAGCNRARDWPKIQRVLAVPGGLLVERAGDIVHLTSLAPDAAAPVVTAAGPAQLLSAGAGGDEPAWVEGADLVTYDPGTETKSTALLPAAAGKPVAVAARWVCGAQGLYHRGTDGSWSAVSLPMPCEALAARGDVAVVAGSAQIARCLGAACAAAALPRRFAPDGVLGARTDKRGALTAVVALGDRLYEWPDGGAVADVTPVTAAGSALRARVARIAAPGLVAVDGGGVLVLRGAAGNAEPLQLRIE